MDQREERDEMPADARTRSWELPIEPGGELSVESDALGLTLIGIADGETPRIEAKGTWREPPRVNVERAGRAVSVHVEATGLPFFGWWGGRRVRVALYVPRGIVGRVTTRFGHLKVRDVRDADVRLVSDAGAIQVRRFSGQLDARTAAGGISVEELSGSFAVETSAGGIDVDVRSLAAGHHRAHTDAGGIKVQLAAGIVTRIDARTDFGGADVRHPSTGSAPSSIELSTHAGGIQVVTSRWSDAATPAVVASGSPYRLDAAATHDVEVERVLGMVADGKLTPADARELLRALGV